MTEVPFSAEGCPSGLAPPSGSDVTDPTPFVRRVGGQSRLSLSVRGAKCGGCISRIEGALNKLPGVETARLNLSNGQLDVRWTGDLAALRISQAVSGLGYGVAPLDANTGDDANRKDERSLLLAMGVAGFATANIMLLSVSVWGGHGEMGEATRKGLHALSGLIALPTLLYSGRPFFRSAWNVLKRGRTNMDVPISLALILAFSVSVAETISGGEHAYFDAACMLLFFLLIGRFLDARVRRRAYSAARDLAALSNRTVTRLNARGNPEPARAEDVRPGDRILLAPGERAVVDMVIEVGVSEVDESLVSGESLPRCAAPGSSMLAGAINLSHPLTGRATAAAADSLLSDIGRMLEAGEQKRSTYRRIADRAVTLYVPFVHSAALLTFLGWWLTGTGVREAILIAVSTLIITCPCALALAAPVVQVVAAGRLFRSGIFLRSGDALERIAACDHVVFDKTGTLTLGTPRLSSTDLAESTIADAACLARASRHPLSRALTAVAGPGPVAADVKEHPGLGLEAQLDGIACRLGSAEWTGARTTGHTGASLFFARGTEAPIEFRFEDDIQPDALKALDHLRRLGLSFEIVSGDHASAVQETARRLGMDHWTAAASPQEKVARLRQLESEGRCVLMIGDGLNDAGALALSHASAAPGGALDISQSASDAVYSKGLASLPMLVRTARGARSAMLQNFGFAAAYNLVAVPIAVMGHATPLVAAIAMSASSTIVCLNALRLNFNEKAMP
ncbi:MAG: heavy metal translocating P-type ATPase [Hyphomonas sp.]|uniref:heavy metal translocating P-type ATPase n=1 Tax=Hyphomonas sp. TaxID=87 RepID=UPI00183C3DE0|nr:heavy metal translocating P-type ATPase [Hyphomonas sp.]MBA3070140.1 heavy metal translocating P-type ATPase [Hyphomonas sp.]MBU4060284.1 heavy metal translocating P-type ATPase [Alphaproteobacteria bacterium]MBU4162952.1 heavy metal translocating P-type ATPase [Alphaproteobacteria bacterium]